MEHPDELELPESRWNHLQHERAPAAPDIPESLWNRPWKPKPPSAWPRRLASVLSVVVVVPLVYAMPAHGAARAAPATQKEAPVSGTKVPILPPLADPVEKHAWKAPPGVTWPELRKVTLAASSVPPADFPVRLATKGVKTQAEPVSVELLDTDRLGLAMRVMPGQRAATARATRMEIDYSGFRHAYGGDYAARLRLTKVAECALKAATLASCPQPQPVPSSNDTRKSVVTAEIEPGAVYALVAAPSGPAGDHAATSLAPSSDWSVGTQTGSFDWNHELRTPPALGGEAPKISLDYSSQSLDGRTSSTNNQASWAGDGFELNPGGFIERRYKSCMIDGKKTGDLCWDQDNAILSLGNSSVELVKDATTKQWKPKRDDGTRIEMLTGAANGDNNGEHWQVTAADGIQYTFGLNRLPGWVTGKPETKSVQTVPVFGNNSGEPCHSTTPANAWCQQAYRWNLDYVVDTHDNATTFWYAQEKNHYGRNSKPELGTVYDRAAYLTRIDYGYRRNELFTRSPAAQVTFDVAERCLPSGTVACAPEQLKKETARHWPDVPFDQICDAGVRCTDRVTPTFFTRKRLTKVTTRVLDPAGSYYPVDSWELAHQFPATGDGLSPALWLASIQQTGHVGGTITLPKITFAGLQLANRVDAKEGRPPLYKWRVQAVNNGSGGELRIDYKAAECVPGQHPAPDKNTRLCFPQRWAPPDEIEVVDWFHKYVVEWTKQVDLVAGSPDVVTSYEYLDGAGWHYADNTLIKPEHRTWADFRGFGRVRVGEGVDTERTLKEFRYFRGMHGDKQTDGSKRTAQVEDSEGVKVDDLDQYAGLEREEIVYGDGGAIVTATVQEPWSQKTAESTQDNVTKNAYFVETASVVTRTALADGKWRRTGEKRKYDDRGLVTEVADQGALASADDDQCTRYTYARDDDSWMLNYLSRIQKVAAGCGTAVSTLAASDMISDEKVQYDGKEFGEAPTQGNVTSVHQAVSGDGATITDSTHTYDVYGREISRTDAVGTRTAITYSPAAGAPVTEVTETNQLGHTQRTFVEPAWGEPVAEIDANNRRVDLEHDALGRLIKVWQSDRSKAAEQSPNTEYAYTIRTDGPGVVTTKTLGGDGNYVTSHTLFDGLLRERQTQEPAPRDEQAEDPALRDGRTITDTFFNSQGEKSKLNTGYFSTGTPSTELLSVADTAVPTQVETLFDGSGEIAAQVIKSKGVEQLRLSAEHQGDRIHVTPPPGGTATTRISDARDRLIELRQYKGATPTGAYDSTKYTFDHAGRLATVTDPAGNVWRHHYDLRGREIKTEDPDKGVTTTTYNDADEIVSTTDARGRTLWYGYDALGRKTQLRESSASGTLLAEWKYDALAKGHMNASVRYVDGQAYKAEINAIDADYRTLRQTVTIPAREDKLAGSYRLNTRYTLDGQVQSVSFPEGGGLAEEQVVYSYDHLNQPVKVSGLSTYLSGASYTKLGETLQYALGEGTRKTWLTYTHDEATRSLTGMRLDRSGSDKADLDLRYAYDKMGNITKVADQAGGQDTQCFTYDHLRRMTAAWTATDDCASKTPTSGTIGGVAPYAISYSYDVTGNRTKEIKHAWGSAGEQVREYTYPMAGTPQPHALQSVGEDLFEYDAAGNTTRRKVGTTDQSLIWDAEGNLESVTEAGRTTSFVYDADGDRLLRKTPTDATLYIDDMELRFDQAKDVVEQTRYYTVNNQAIAVRTPDDKVYFLANDHQGTAQAAVNADTGELAIRKQTPFGEERGAPPPWWPGQRGFVGGTLDPTIGLIHLGAREYDPKLGRFLSVDPVINEEDPQQFNAYVYANNSPVSASDPDGQLLWFVVGIGARIAARAIARRLAAQARQRRLAQAEARRVARLKALEVARKKALAIARRRAWQAKAKAIQKAVKAAFEAAARRAAAAARKAAEAAKSAARPVRSRRSSSPPPRSQKQPPAKRPTSRHATQRPSPPKAARSPANPPSQPQRPPLSITYNGRRITEGQMTPGAGSASAKNPSFYTAKALGSTDEAAEGMGRLRTVAEYVEDLKVNEGRNVSLFQVFLDILTKI